MIEKLVIDTYKEKRGDKLRLEYVTDYVIPMMKKFINKEVKDLSELISHNESGILVIGFRAKTSVFRELNSEIDSGSVVNSLFFNSNTWRDCKLPTSSIKLVNLLSSNLSSSREVNSPIDLGSVFKPQP